MNKFIASTSQTALILKGQYIFYLSWHKLMLIRKDIGNVDQGMLQALVYSFTQLMYIQSTALLYGSLSVCHALGSGNSQFVDWLYYLVFLGNTQKDKAARKVTLMSSASSSCYYHNTTSGFHCRLPEINTTLHFLSFSLFSLCCSFSGWVSQPQLLL